MFPLYGKDNRTDHERYLEDELEHEREQSRREQERKEEARQQRQEEYRERREREARSANSWPEAFEKQASLCWREFNSWPNDVAGVEDSYFEKLAQANEKALEIWREVSASKQAELDELQKQIEAVWDAVRNEVADKLIAANDHSTYKATAEAIRDDQLDGYLDW